MAEEQLLLTLIAIDILASQKVEEVVHVDEAICGVENMARLLEDVTGPSLSHVL